MKNILLTALLSFLYFFGAMAQKTATCSVTFYHAGKSTRTADGSRIDQKKLANGTLNWCALSPDLLKKFPYGTKIEVEGYGCYEVHDRTSGRHRKLIDILLPKGKRLKNGRNIKVSAADGQKERL